MTHRSIPQIINFIHDNRRIFRPGARFSQEVLMEFFGIQMPITLGSTASIIKNVQKFQLEKLSAQTRLNNILNSKGLGISQNGDDYVIWAGLNDNAEKPEELRLTGAAKIQRSAAVVTNYREHRGLLGRRTTMLNAHSRGEL